VIAKATAQRLDQMAALGLQGPLGQVGELLRVVLAADQSLQHCPTRGSVLRPGTALRVDSLLVDIEPSAALVDPFHTILLRPGGVSRKRRVSPACSRIRSRGEHVGVPQTTPRSHSLTGSTAPVAARPLPGPCRVYATFMLRGWPKAMAIHSREAEGGSGGCDAAPQGQRARSGAGFTPAKRRGGLGGATQHPPEQSRPPRAAGGSPRARRERRASAGPVPCRRAGR
jgi:hypothetical protein